MLVLGGGGVFIDRFVPGCVRSVDIACSNCSFENNVAGYGRDVGTIAKALVLKNDSLSRKWELMAQYDISIGATDALGQMLAGSHSPVLIRTKLIPRNLNITRVHLTSNASKIIRNGYAQFQAMALQLPVNETANKDDTPLTLLFAADSSSRIVQTQGIGIAPLSVNLTLAKCEQELLNKDGRCLVEANVEHEQIVVSIVVAVVVSCGFVLVLFYAYRNTNRVIATLRSSVTSFGAIVLKLLFELLDMVSDALTLVKLFQYDVSFKQPTLVRVAYVTCFSIAAVPSLLLVRATIETLRAQWRRIGTDQRSTNHRNEVQAKVTTEGTPQEVTEKVHIIQPSSAVVHPHNEIAESDEVDPDRFATAHTNHLEQELEYLRIRDTLFKRMLARMISEDFLLLILNMYIYLANRDDEIFAKSKFRDTLEFSILMSAIHLGAQCQAIVIWLQADKLTDVRGQLKTIRTLHTRYQTEVRRMSRASIAPLQWPPTR